MKIYFIKYNTLYKIIALALAIIIGLAVAINLLNNRTKETFNNFDIHYKGNIDKKIVAFTCNVDWGNEYIPPMLEILRNHDIKITFFVTGRWAEKYPELLKTIYDEGHEIGNHGYLHRDYSKLSYELNREEILKADSVLKNITGIKPKYFAPPSGAYNDFTVKAAKDLQYTTIMWSIDTIDWRNDSTKDKIINRVLSNLHNSGIVLMHPKAETVKAIPELIKSLKEKNFEICRVSDLIE